ncbi:MAG: malic enzyme-like NAD(P)-binding protein [Arhodomonas sp.]|nr:malic enzyme-like NAD(P)-binding protein [Arhodomonas sp.]
MDPRKAVYARDTEARSLVEAIDGADIFLGLSAPRVLKPELLKGMARDPLILALANPVPEILPEDAREARPDAIIATGRSDYPNQVNNVLCFPFIFRGALDVGATDINDEMKKACGAGHRRPGPGRGLGHRGGRLRRQAAEVRPRLPSSPSPSTRG